MLLVAENLVVDRGARTILDRVSFTVRAGEALVLTGQNGAGKTTLIRTLAGFLQPTSGMVRLEGGAEDHELAEECHYVGHQSGIRASLTVAENLNFWAGYLGLLDGCDRDMAVEHALEKFGLLRLADIQAGYLSAGQKRRLGLARLLVAKRAVWLLDEPTVSLDAASTEILSGIVSEHVAQGGIAVAATHVPLAIASARELRLAPRSGSVSGTA